MDTLHVDDSAATGSSPLDGHVATPKVFRGLVRDWPLVAAGQRSFEAVRSLLLEHASWKRKTAVFSAPAEFDGRFAYDATLRNFNFTSEPCTLDDLFRRLDQARAAASGESLYAGSVPVAEFAPGLVASHQMPLLAEKHAQPRLWIGNKTRVSAHFDASANLACVACGTRRFTLFPPDQLRNLYPGPLDRTPAGQAISLVDFHRPDFERFPRFREALGAAVVVDLAPGDALYIPSMWWHHVECPGPLGVMVNYWWHEEENFGLSPSDALIAAFVALAALPVRERTAWRDLFDHYVFGPRGDEQAHLSDSEKGLFGPLGEDNAGVLLRYLCNAVTSASKRHARPKADGGDQKRGAGGVT